MAKFIVEVRSDHPVTHAFEVEAETWQEAEEKVTCTTDTKYIGAVSVGGAYDDCATTHVYKLTDDGRIQLCAELNASDVLAECSNEPDEETYSNYRALALPDTDAWPGETIRELKDAIRGLFEQCAMIHKYGGEGYNQREADAAIEAAQALIAE